MVFLENLQNSQERTYARVFLTKMADRKPATLSKTRLWHMCFLVNFVKFLRTTFLRTPPDDCFWTCATATYDVKSHSLHVKTESNRCSETLFALVWCMLFFINLLWLLCYFSGLGDFYPRIFYWRSSIASWYWCLSETTIKAHSEPTQTSKILLSEKVVN